MTIFVSKVVDPLDDRFAHRYAVVTMTQTLAQKIFRRVGLLNRFREEGEALLSLQYEEPDDIVRFYEDNVIFQALFERAPKPEIMGLCLPRDDSFEAHIFPEARLRVTHCQMVVLHSSVFWVATPVGEEGAFLKMWNISIHEIEPIAQASNAGPTG